MVARSSVSFCEITITSNTTSIITDIISLLLLYFPLVRLLVNKVIVLKSNLLNQTPLQGGGCCCFVQGFLIIQAVSVETFPYCPKYSIQRRKKYSEFSSNTVGYDVRTF